MNIEQIILEYKMNKEEALAMRLVSIYLELAYRYFPDYWHCRQPKTGDPRRCEIFRYCWKLIKTTKTSFAQKGST